MILNSAETQMDTEPDSNRLPLFWVGKQFNMHEIFWQYHRVGNNILLHTQPLESQHKGPTQCRSQYDVETHFMNVLNPTYE
jgi:hypothetical protein